MKPPVCITLLIVGAMLLLAPFVFSAVHEHEASATLAAGHLTSIQYDDDKSALGSVSRFGYWLTGTGLCVVAIFGAVSDAHRSAPREPPGGKV